MANADRIIDLLHEAKTRPAGGERERFLEEACGDDAGLKEQIMSLLEAGDDGSEPDFLKMTGIIRPEFPPTEKPGDRIGRFKLLELIGEGGFGRIWMAEQTEPVRRRVALKIVKLGMDTRAVLARFEAERQALALMDHPNIARVFDGGATDTGRPFFVMELVRGVPITEYCDANKLCPRARIALFEKVCHAVQHAHQKGIIHRDLKPSNILVTVYDDQPVPKVIDFGVAKALQANLTERTLFTRFNQWIGTPAYMSPEQAGLGSLDVDVRSDVYSLGAILYELLTGNTPFDPMKLRQEGYDALLRTIREEDAPKPSTRLSALPREDLRNIADHRGESPEKLGRALRGELDWILLKSLDRDRSRRYETASAMANDLARYSAGEVISAAPPSFGYRARKVLRRHWKVATIAASFFVLIVAGGLTSTILAIREGKAASRARHAEGLAEHEKESALAERNRALANYYLAGMTRAREDWQVGNVNRTEEMLMEFLPRAGVPDLRGWEWYYLTSLLEGDDNLLRPGLGPVWNLSFSADGALLAVAGEGVAIYERQSRKLVRKLPGRGPVAWHPKERILAAVEVRDGKAGINLWDGRSWVASGRIESGPIWSLSWRPDGAALAWAGTGEFGIWEQGMDAPEFHPCLRTESQGSIFEVDWSPDGRELVMGLGFPAQLLIWDRQDRNLQKPIHVWMGTFVNDLKWSAANGWVAIGTHTGGVEFWDVAKGENKLRIGDAHGGELTDVAWRHDGKRLATCGLDRLVKVWNLEESGRLEVQFAGHRDPVSSVAWTPDGSQIASGSADGSVRLWMLDRDQANLSLPGKVSFAWSPDGRKVASTVWEAAQGDQDPLGSLVIYDAETGMLERKWGPLQGLVGKLDWSPDGNLLGIATNGTRVPHCPGEVQIWDLNTGRMVHRLAGVHESECRRVTFSPDGSQFATSGADYRVKIWETSSARLLRILDGHDREVGTVQWSPNGRRLLSEDWNRHVRIWDTATWECLWNLRQPESSGGVADGGNCAAWSPDSQRIVTRSGAGDLVVFQLNEDQPPVRIWTKSAHSSNIRSIDWSPDGRRIATSSEDSFVKVWDAATGREMLSFDHVGWVQTVVWSPDGNRLGAVAGVPSTVVIYDARKALGVNWDERIKSEGQREKAAREPHE